MKLTTTRLFLAFFSITIVAVIGGLIWLHEREPAPDPSAGPRGPSDLIRLLRKQQQEKLASERRAMAESLRRAAAASDASAW